jgi:hypothetical protein
LVLDVQAREVLLLLLLLRGFGSDLRVILASCCLSNPKQSASSLIKLHFHLQLQFNRRSPPALSFVAFPRRTSATLPPFHISSHEKLSLSLSLSLSAQTSGASPCCSFVNNFLQ